MQIHLKFRAECQHDVDQVKRLAPRMMIAHMKVTPWIHEGHVIPDVDVEVFLCDPYTENDFLNVLRQVDDGHVMVQTLALAEKYTGERDYERA